MSAHHQILLVVGLFGVPLALLAGGHRVRRTSDRHQRAFWGAVVGHCTAAAVALVASLAPPVGWEATDTFRGIAGIWSLVVLPFLGAAVAALTTPRQPSA